MVIHIFNQGEVQLGLVTLTINATYLARKRGVH